MKSLSILIDKSSFRRLNSKIEFQVEFQVKVTQNFKWKLILNVAFKVFDVAISVQIGFFGI